MSGRCKCPKGKTLLGNECKLLKVCPEGYIRLYNNTCIKKCPNKQIRVGNECIKCPTLSIKIEDRNICKSFIKKRDPIYFEKKPVIYLYPEETMDISVHLNLKNSKFTTIYPEFNDENTWNVRAKPNGDILMNGKHILIYSGKLNLIIHIIQMMDLLFLKKMQKNSLKKN